MPASVVTLTVAAQPSHVGTCELCATADVVLAAAALIRHSHGGAVRLAACDRCARAVRRLVAAIGPSGMVAEPAVPDRRARGPARTAVGVITAPPVRPPASPPGPARPVAELTSEVVSSDGGRWVPTVFGAPRADGTWAGWIEFAEIGGARVLRTGQETSQPDLEALVYWATGLEPAFLEGAFDRAAG